MLDINIAPLVCVMAAILLDIISGVIKAGATNTMSSSIMREGLWHKCALILLEVVALCCSMMPMYVEGLPQELSLVYVGISGYIVLMELVSILENLGTANPQLANAKIFDIFGLGDKKE